MDGCLRDEIALGSITGWGVRSCDKQFTNVSHGWLPLVCSCAPELPWPLSSLWGWRHIVTSLIKAKLAGHREGRQNSGKEEREWRRMLKEQ